MKNVLIIAGKIGLSSGAYHSLKTNLIEFKKRQINPIVVLYKHGIIENELKKIGIKTIVIRYESCTVPFNNPSKIKGIVKETINFFSEFKLQKIIKTYAIEIIHINVGTVSFGATTALKNDIPLVWHIREFLEEDVNMTYINAKKMTKLLNSANKIITISDAVANHFKEKYNIKNPITIYNGIYDVKYEPQKNYQKENKMFFTIIGRIVPEKGQLEALSAFEKLYKINNKVKLNIVGNVGNETYYDKIIEFINKNNLENVVDIYEHQKDLTEIWNKTNIGLVCSKKEGFGRVTAEYMLNNIPVIGSNTGGTTELLTDNRGLLYEYGNIEDLFQNMKYCTNNNENLESIKKNAHMYAKKMFTSDKCASEIEKVYQNLIKK